MKPLTFTERYRKKIMLEDVLLIFFFQINWYLWDFFLSRSHAQRFECTLSVHMELILVSFGIALFFQASLFANEFEVWLEVNHACQRILLGMFDMWLVNSPHKWLVTRIMFPFDVTSSCDTPDSWLPYVINSWLRCYLLFTAMTQIRNYTSKAVNLL